VKTFVRLINTESSLMTTWFISPWTLTAGRTSDCRELYYRLVTFAFLRAGTKRVSLNNVGLSDYRTISDSTLPNAWLPPLRCCSAVAVAGENGNVFPYT